MKVAVTYENGEVFQHFGRTPAFKVYEISDGKVISSEVVDTNGTGHGALAGFLKESNSFFTLFPYISLNSVSLFISLVDCTTDLVLCNIGIF